MSDIRYMYMLIPDKESRTRYLGEIQVSRWSRLEFGTKQQRMQSPLILGVESQLPGP